MESRRSIIFFIDSLSGGGAERICTILANNFSRRAYKVEVVTIKMPLPTDYALAPEVTRISLAAARSSRNIANAITNNAALVLKLRRLINHKQPDYLISLMTQGNVVCSFACINIKTVHIASERNYPPMQSIGATWNLLRKYSYLLPKVIVSQTQKTSNWIEKNTKCTKTAVIPNPVIYPLQSTPSQDTSGKTTLINSGRKIILGVGRLVNQKQFDSLIAAFSIISEDYLDWDLVIVGEGPNRSSLQQQIDTLKLRHRVQLIGKQGNMGYWYNQAKIFVLSSKFEGYPNALLEAMCHGVPPISYNCDTGPDSIIEHRVNGILVPVDDEKQLASGMCKLIENPELREKMGEKAKEVVDSHSIESIVTQWEALFGFAD